MKKNYLLYPSKILFEIDERDWKGEPTLRKDAKLVNWLRSSLVKITNYLYGRIVLLFFNGVSSFVDYLMLKSSLEKNSSDSC